MPITDSQKKIYLPRLAMMLWVFFFPLTLMLLTPPPEKLGAYCFFACLALVPLIWGSRGYRLFGLIAVVISLCSAVNESRAGVRYKLRVEQIQQKSLERNSTTNTPATNASSLKHE